ncbi:hypothetical protein F5882DRAFT_422848 [Hyaloscypha sp. PMI_1271]|nr:hypothetical protein F5882DRAFT_422848 [Hyaloscypha sp. PMI_1271]
MKLAEHRLVRELGSRSTNQTGSRCRTDEAEEEEGGGLGLGVLSLQQWNDVARREMPRLWNAAESDVNHVAVWESTTPNPITVNDDPSGRKLYSNAALNDWPPGYHHGGLFADEVAAEVFGPPMPHEAYCNGTTGITYLLSRLSLRKLLGILLAYFGLLAASSATVVMAETNIGNQLPHTDQEIADHSVLYIVCFLLAFLFGGYLASLVSGLQRSGRPSLPIRAAIGLMLSLLGVIADEGDGRWLIFTILFGLMGGGVCCWVFLSDCTCGNKPCTCGSGPNGGGTDRLLRE